MIFTKILIKFDTCLTQEKYFQKLISSPVFSSLSKQSRDLKLKQIFSVWACALCGLLALTCLEINFVITEDIEIKLAR